MANLKILIKEFLSNFYYKENNHIILNIFGLKFGIFRRIRKCNIIGKNNCFILKYKSRNGIFKKYKKVNGLTVNIKGDNNVIILKTRIFKNCLININSSNSRVEIGEDCKLNNLEVIIDFGDNQKLTIGNKVSSWSIDMFLREEGSSISIGDNCMFSKDVAIWATDSHSIIDKTTKQVLNKPSGVVIGDHVWVCYGAHLCKSAKISNNSVVGARSVVTKRFDEENIVIAGNPAKIIKRNIEWDGLPPTPKERELNNINNPIEVNQ